MHEPPKRRMTKPGMRLWDAGLKKKAHPCLLLLVAPNTPPPHAGDKLIVCRTGRHTVLSVSVQVAVDLTGGDVVGVAVGESVGGGCSVPGGR
jgi:hypothetical protein